MPDTPIDERNPPMFKEVSENATILLSILTEAGYRMDVPEENWPEAEEIAANLRRVTLSEPFGPEGNRIRVLMMPDYVEDSGSAN